MNQVISRKREEPFKRKSEGEKAYVIDSLILIITFFQGKFEAKVLEFYLKYWDLSSSTPFDQALRFIFLPSPSHPSLFSLFDSYLIFELLFFNRKFLTFVRLPKESQKIDRVIHGFAKYFAQIAEDPIFKYLISYFFLCFFFSCSLFFFSGTLKMFIY